METKNNWDHYLDNYFKENNAFVFTHNSVESASQKLFPATPT